MNTHLNFERGGGEISIYLAGDALANLQCSLKQAKGDMSYLCIMKTVLKVIIWILFLAIMPLVAFSQNNNIIVKDSFYIPIGNDFVVFQYNSPIDTVEWGCFHQGIHCHINGYASIYGSDQVPFYLHPLGNNIVEIRVTPNEPKLYDTAWFHYLPNSNEDPYCLECLQLPTEVDFIVSAYYDSKIKIIPFSLVDYLNSYYYYDRMPYDSIYFIYDTIANKYIQYSYTRSPGIYNYAEVMIFNNKADSVVLSDWKFLYDSTRSLSFTMKQDTSVIQSIAMAPFSHRYNLSFIFQSTLPPQLMPRSFPGAIQCTAHFGGKDSVCVIPYIFYFQGGPKSDIEKINGTDKVFSVYPNPTSGSVQISCKGYSQSVINLQINDELGQEIMKVFDGKLKKDETFLVNLRQGIYFVQMRTIDGILMKKIVVE